MRKGMFIFRVLLLGIVVFGSVVHVSAQSFETDSLSVIPRDTVCVSKQFMPRSANLYSNQYLYNPTSSLYTFPKMRMSTFKLPSINWPKYDRVLKWGVPAALIGAGVLCKTTPSIAEEIDHETAFEVQEHVNQSFPIDDYTQYVPFIGVYALDLFGVPAKHTLKERLVLGATSAAIMGAAVNTMKHSIQRTRPDGSNNLSFPSGHTAMAFTGAHLLCKEYKDASIWIPIAGYSVAAFTAGLRVVNNKHYISDTLAGAGIGILSVELAYQTLPFWRRVLKLPADKQFVLSPVVGNKQLGAYMSFTF